MAEETTQSQVTELQPEVVETGEQIASQSPAAVAEREPGAAGAVSPQEVKPEVSKPLTEQEIRDREAKILSQKDQEIQRYREAIFRQRMDQEVARIAEVERKAREQDKADIEGGLITESDGQARQRARMAILQRRAEFERLDADVARLEGKGERLGHLLMAEELAREFGISMDVLVKDSALDTPLKMTRKAAELALKQRDTELRQFRGKVETFDKGPTVAAGTLGDDAFLKAYAAGESDDHKRAQKLLGG